MDMLLIIVVLLLLLFGGGGYWARGRYLVKATTLSFDTSINLNTFGLSKGDIYEKSTTDIHHGGDIAAGCQRCVGANHEDR